MSFAHDTEVALLAAASLVNTASGGEEALDRVGLDAFLEQYTYSGRIVGDEEELRAVRAVRTRVAAAWRSAGRDAVAGLCNELLRDTDAQPYLARHDEWDWHLHVTGPDAPLADRIAAESAMAFADLIRTDDLDRLRTCEAPDCSDVLVDLSRNRSKRYCDTGNCGNRQHVAAYRARQAGDG